MPSRYLADLPKTPGDLILGSIPLRTWISPLEGRVRKDLAGWLQLPR